MFHKSSEGIWRFLSSKYVLRYVVPLPKQVPFLPEKWRRTDCVLTWEARVHLQRCDALTGAGVSEGLDYLATATGTGLTISDAWPSSLFLVNSIFYSRGRWEMRSCWRLGFQMARGVVTSQFNNVHRPPPLRGEGGLLSGGGVLFHFAPQDSSGYAATAAPAAPKPGAELAEPTPAAEVSERSLDPEELDDQRFLEAFEEAWHQPGRMRFS